MKTPAVAPESSWQPLADRMRPRSLDEFVGQQHLLGPGKPLTGLVGGGKLHSAILWGPPGTGKTTLARLIAKSAAANFIGLSAVLAGVKDVREAVAAAQARRDQPTVLFLDEVHRFNKAQQDAFLPFVEDGTLVFIGATTENPSFELNNALLSRARVYVLKALTPADIVTVLERALGGSEEGLAALRVHASADALLRLATAADGDARRALNLLDLAAELATARSAGGRAEISDTVLEQVLTGGWRRFDKGGDYFYDQISALHKSVRGSDPDAALYWLARMLDGGCDPHYLARRIVRMASEDIGLADPRALSMTLEAWQAYDRLGSPEGELAIAQAVVFLACAAKSNAVYEAFQAAQSDVRALGTLELPAHLRNAPTRLAKELGHGAGYRYAHKEPEAFAAGERYFPDEMPVRQYYEPTGRGMEERIAAKLAELRARNRAARSEPTG